MRPAVFLDRDGVLNEPIARGGKPYSPMNVDEFSIYPEARAACERLREAGYALVCVTNQPEVSRGTLSTADLADMHSVLLAAVDLDRIEVCPHDDRDGCNCRKPLPGMLLRAAAVLEIDLAASFMVGDRWRDVEAGRAAGCSTVFLDRGWDEKQPDQVDCRVRSLAEAAAWVLGRTGNDAVT